MKSKGSVAMAIVVVAVDVSIAVNGVVPVFLAGRGSFAFNVVSWFQQCEPKASTQP